MVEVTAEDKATLESWIRATTTEQRLVLRARIIAGLSAGQTNQEVAVALSVRPAAVSKWRARFGREGLAGLVDAPRSGKPATYTEETARRVLATLDEPPPVGYARWNGPLLAQALGDVSAAQVWRVLRRHGISLERRRSWCISTDPEFAAKAADIVGLYLNPPENAVVLCVDEKPHIQALERAQGYLRLPSGKAVRGVSHEYKRHGTTTLFAALDMLSGAVLGKHTTRRRRREFLVFMNEVVAAHPDQELHVILDNLSTHKPKHDRWLVMHPNVRFHFTPTHASWLNQIEVWFSILSRQALRGASFASARELREAIDRFIASYNDQAAPFEWTKRDVHSVHPKQMYAELLN